MRSRIDIPIAILACQNDEKQGIRKANPLILQTLRRGTDVLQEVWLSWCLDKGNLSPVRLEPDSEADKIREQEQAFYETRLCLRPSSGL